MNVEQLLLDETLPLASLCLATPRILAVLLAPALFSVDTPSLQSGRCYRAPIECEPRDGIDRSERRSRAHAGAARRAGGRWRRMHIRRRGGWEDAWHLTQAPFGPYRPVGPYQ